MKVFILSVTAGEGHNSMAKAVLNETKKRGSDAVLIDYFKNVAPFRAWLAQPFYFFVLRYFPKTERKVYAKLMNRDITAIPKRFSALRIMISSKKANRRVLNLIKEYKPDVIYCTHVYAAIIIAYLKRGKYIDIPSIFIVSDYNVIPYTEWAQDNDYILSPSPEVNETLLRCGYKEKQILPYGITVDPKFSVRHDRYKLARSLGINPAAFTIFLSGGGTGFGKTYDLLKKALEANVKAQIIVVNGRNEESYARIQELIDKKKAKNVLNYGFVSNMHELMAVSDIMIGKLGGVGVTEAFNMGLPILCPSPAPFQEQDNGIYLANKGCVINAKNNDEALSVLQDLMNNPAKLENLKKAVRAVRRPNATIDLVNFMEKLTYERPK